MKRLLSILLLAAFALPLIAPLLALAQDPDADLPACCRRHGQHHCTMLDREKDPAAHRFVAICPYYPQYKAVPAVRTIRTVHTASLHIPDRSTALPRIARSEASHRTTRDRARYKRGPPKDSLKTA